MLKCNQCLSLLRLVVGCFADTVQFAVLLVILWGRAEFLLLLVFRWAGISVFVSVFVLFPVPMSVPLSVFLPLSIPISISISVSISVSVLIPVPFLVFVVMPVPIPVSVSVSLLFPLTFMGWWRRGSCVCTVRGMCRLRGMWGVRSSSLDCCCSSLGDGSSRFLLFFL